MDKSWRLRSELPNLWIEIAADLGIGRERALELLDEQDPALAHELSNDPARVRDTILSLLEASEREHAEPGKRTRAQGRRRDAVDEPGKRTRIEADARRRSSTTATPSRSGPGAGRFDRAAAGVRGTGQPLPHLEVIQPLFGDHDLGDVRAHTDDDAAAASEQLGTRGYVLGDDVAFDGAPDLRVAAHEAAHVVQQRAGVMPEGGRGRPGDPFERHADAVADAVVAGRSAAALLASLPAGSAAAGAALQLFNEADYAGMTPVDAVRKALDDDEADDALILMGRLDATGANTVLNSYQSKATSCFGNDEIGRATVILVGKGGSLAKALEWMFDEGTNWNLLNTTIRAATGDKSAIRTNYWRDKFVGELGNDEMAQLVDLLGGDLAWKLTWMFAEGTDWTHIKAKVSAAPQAERTALNTGTWRDTFIGELGNDEIAELVDLIGGDLPWKLGWMFAEGTDWTHIKAKVTAAPQAERNLINTGYWRDKFIGELGNDEIAELVDLIGGDLPWKLGWMFAEGTDWSHVRAKITAAPQAEKDLVKTDYWRDKFGGELGNDEFAELVDLLGGNIAFKLSWMIWEGTDWAHMRAKINASPVPERADLRTDAWRDKFISELDNDEMAELVDLLGGDLAFKLTWMFAEGTDWDHLRTKITAAPATERTALSTDAWRNKFVGELDNDEMAELMDLLGFDLLKKLQWMAAEGTDWDHMRAKINAAPAAERTALYTHDDMRNLFVSECNDEEMAEAVGLLGGTLVNQLTWMAAEGSNATLIKVKVDAASATDRLAVYTDDTCKTLIKESQPIPTRVLIIQALAGTPQQQMELFGNGPSITLLTWATPTADWVDAITAVRTDPLDMLEIAKGAPATWGPLIRPKLSTMLSGYTGTVYPDDRVAVVWAAYDTGAGFNAAQSMTVFRAIFGRPIQAAGDDITFLTGPLKRDHYVVIAPADDTMRTAMQIFRNLGRAEVAAGQIAFAAEVREESLGITGWHVTNIKTVDTSYYYHDGTIIIRVLAGGVMDTDPIPMDRLGMYRRAYGTGLDYFHNHMRHEIGHAVGARTFGDMSESGNDFAEAYGGWDSSSKSAFASAMWAAQAMPATGWPTVTFPGGGTATVTDAQAKEWCLGLLADGEQCNGPIKNAAGTIQEKLTALATAPALWAGEQMVQYLRAIGSNTPDGLRDIGFRFPGYTPPSTVHLYAKRGYDGFATYHKTAYDKLVASTGWYSLSSPVEMFAEMYTRKYSSGTTPDENNGKNPAVFFTQLEAQRDPMFGEPPPDETPMGP